MILYGRTSDYGQNPTQIYFFGSNDGSTWTQLLGATSTTLQSVGGGPNTFTVNASTGYTYFRVVCTLPTGTGAMAIGEMYINGTALTGSSNQDFYADTLGNLTTAAGSGQTLGAWLNGAPGFVTTWYDQSSASNHLTQSTRVNQPLIQPATRGAGYMVLFETSQFLTGFSYSTLANTNYTVCKVDRRTKSIGRVNNGVDNAVISCGVNQTTDQLLHLTYRSGTSAYYGQFGDDYSGTISAFATGPTEPVRYGFFMASSTNGSGRRLYVYGDPLGTVTNFATTNTALLSASGTGNFNLGYYVNGPTYYTGEVYEVIVFNKSLYDIDNTGGQITTLYQNQLNYLSTNPLGITGVKATGGSISTSGGNYIHTFTVIGSSTFTVTRAITSAQVLIVAGGGAGGTWGGAGGGGAGGLIYVSSLSIPIGTYTVTVGSGGDSRSNNGENSVFWTYTSIGGGGGATNGVGITGGSGGGSQSTNPAAIGGSGTVGQGNNGGVASIVSPAFGGGGGGGASAVGQNGSGTYGGNGGDGIQYSISGSPVYYAGGGGGTYTSSGIDGLGGIGGGGKAVFAGPGIDGTPNTGGGGGASGVVNGSGTTRAGGGGSGIVIISYVS